MQKIDTPTSSPLTSAAHTQDVATTGTISASNRPQAVDKYAPHATSLIASALLAACGGGGGGDGSDAQGNALKPSAPGFNNFPQANSDNEAARFLLQTQFAATTEEIARVRGMSFANYLQEQYAKPQTSGWDWLESKAYGADVENYAFSTTIADYMIWNQLMTAPDVARKRAALALSEFFVVSLNSMEIDWRAYAITAYWDLLNQHAFGNFRDLLEAVTLSPAMGHFLNTKGNQKEDGKGRVPDENYAREVMQLFTIGLYELNLDGTERLAANGQKIETYRSEDVSNLAHVFTGYDWDQSYKGLVSYPNETWKLYDREYARRPMVLIPARHSPKAVSFLGVSIPINTPGAAALKTALDTLFKHPNVGPFFARQMIQRLVTSHPSAAYVERVARAFNDNGAGVRGDLRAVWVAILLDDEARGPNGLSSNLFGKLREPMLRFVQWGRTFKLNSKAGTWKISDTMDSASRLGQSPLRSPSVFNFFRPGYVPPGTQLAPSATTAPEFQLHNETSTGGYLNYMRDRIDRGFNVNNPSSPNPDYVANTDSYDIEPIYTELDTLFDHTTDSASEAARIARKIVDKLNTMLCAGQLTTASQTIIVNFLTSGIQTRTMLRTGKTAADRKPALIAAILMIMGSPDYLIQK